MPTQADYCNILGDDGKILDLDENDMPKNMNWIDMLTPEKTKAEKLQFWFDVYENVPTHSKIAEMKALVNIIQFFLIIFSSKKLQ